MAGRNPARLTTIVIGALQQAGLRGIIATDWRGLEAGDLAQALTVAVTDPGLNQKAGEIGENIRQEDGVGEAVAVTLQLMKKPR